MIINRIELNCRRDKAFGGELGADPLLIYFRTPVSYIVNGIDCRTSGASAVILSSGYKQSFRPIRGKTMRYDLVSFRTSAADRQYISSMNLPLDTTIEISDDFVVASVLKSMRSQSMQRGKHFSEFMELSMRLIFISLSDAYNTVPESPIEKIPHYKELRELREAIYDDPTNTWSVEDICKRLRISRTYFHRLYLDAFGVTCRRDVIESRLMNAARLLETTDKSIVEIAEICGYDSESYFMRQFKNHKGCTPSEYRRRMSTAEKG
jgi:AraC-like DNA-binding protein